jgi:riboflavin synthase
MFTGLITNLGRLKFLARDADIMRLGVERPAGWECRLGDSVAVNGLCLTISRLEPECMHFDATRETQTRSTLGAWRTGDILNLEQALLVGSRLDGHLVAGHVDGMARLLAVRHDRNGYEIDLQPPPDCRGYLAEKGSLALDGISLTLARSLGDGAIRIAVIPLTWEKTNLRHRRAGDWLNLEVDILARYAAHWLAQAMPSAAADKEDALADKLRNWGYA